MEDKTVKVIVIALISFVVLAVFAVFTFVVGAFEMFDIGVWMTNIKPHLMPTISTVKNITEHILFSQLFVRRTAFCFGNQLLHLLKGVPTDDRLVDIFEYLPLGWIIFNAFLVLKRFRI